MPIRFRLFATCFFCIVLVTTGCTASARQLKSQPLKNRKYITNNDQTTARFLLYSLEDRRGYEYGHIYASTFIPGINLLHSGRYHMYPENSGLLASAHYSPKTFLVGSLPSDFPHLLADAIRDNRLSPNATPADRIDVKTDLSTFDYVITGKLKTAEMSTHVNIVPLGFLTLLGVPCVFINSWMIIEVSLFKSSDMKNAIMNRNYYTVDSRMVGLYYNHSAYFDLFVGALEEILPRVVDDLAETVGMVEKEKPTSPDKTAFNLKTSAVHNLP